MGLAGAEERLVCIQGHVLRNYPHKTLQSAAKQGVGEQATARPRLRTKTSRGQAGWFPQVARGDNGDIEQNAVSKGEVVNGGEEERAVDYGGDEQSRGRSRATTASRRKVVHDSHNDMRELGQSGLVSALWGSQRSGVAGVVAFILARPCAGMTAH